MANLLGQVFDNQKIVNGDFYEWSGGSPVGWQNNGVSIVEDSVNKFIGAKSARLSAGVQGDLYQQLSGVHVLYGRTWRAQAWVKTSVASSARLIIEDIDGTAASDWHTGGGFWEELVVEKAIDSTPGDVYVRLEVRNGAQVNFDNVKFSLWHFDEEYVFNGDKAGDFTIESLITMDPGKGYYVAQEQRDITIISVGEDVILYTKYIDLMPLIPEKFHSTETLLEDFIYQAGRYVGTWLSSIDDLTSLQDPYSVDDEYIHYLADLIGLTLVEDEDTTLEDLRNQLSQAIDWYKIKGTYLALSIVVYLTGYRGNIYDLYTNDYVNFVKVGSWFVADGDENPPGLDSSYYKSPHFVLEIILDTKYETSSNPYLWKDSQLGAIVESVESMRPANTVPHYAVLLNPITTVDEACHTTTEGIITRVTQNWQQATLNFDMSGSSIFWSIDGGKRFDRPQYEFLNGITKWRLGTGNKNVSPCDSNFAIENVVLTGTISSVTIYSDRVEYEVIVPEENYAVQGLSELVLLEDDNVTEVVHSTFPNVDKTAGVELRILVQIYFTY